MFYHGFTLGVGWGGRDDTVTFFACGHMVDAAQLSSRLHVHTLCQCYAGVVWGGWNDNVRCM